MSHNSIKGWYFRTGSHCSCMISSFSVRSISSLWRGARAHSRGGKIRKTWPIVFLLPLLLAPALSQLQSKTGCVACRNNILARSLGRSVRQTGKEATPGLLARNSKVNIIIRFISPLSLFLVHIFNSRIALGFCLTVTQKYS